jgi:hypothetical protein
MPEDAVEAVVADTTTAADPVGTDAHFEAALAAAIKEAPPPSADDKADPAVIAESEQRQAKADEADARANANDPAKAEAEPESKPEPEPVKVEPTPGTLGKARRLFNEGKIEEALELALGINLDKIEPTTKQWRGVKRIAAEARAEAATAKATADKEANEARQVLQQVMPFVDGAQAYLKGDFATFLKLTTGDTPEQFQRKLVEQLHSAPAADPAVMRRIEQLEQERKAERAAWQAEQQRMQQENARLQYAQAQREYVAELTEELKAVPQFAKVASKPAFLQRVVALQQEAYNHKTKTTIDTIEAAEMVWDDLYGDVVETNPPAGGKAGLTQAPRANGVPTERAGASTAGKTTTTLRHDKPTEAAPELSGEWSPENQEKILDRYTRMAKSELVA